MNRFCAKHGARVVRLGQSRRLPLLPTAWAADGPLLMDFMGVAV